LAFTDVRLPLVDTAMSPAPTPRLRAATKPNARPLLTVPEQTLRRMLHMHGLRFSLRPRDLPGQPDIVLPRRRTVIFLRGCFWHGHGCKLDRAAARFNAGTWAEKIVTNQIQAERDQAALRFADWQVETVWECQIEQRSVIDQLAERLLRR
jgi:DNA mismatch endonuclease (patch repair protein)